MLKTIETNGLMFVLDEQNIIHFTSIHDGGHSENIGPDDPHYATLRNMFTDIGRSNTREQREQNALRQVEWSLKRAKALDPRSILLDWEAYDITKTTLLAIANLLPPELALQVTNVVGTTDQKFQAFQKGER